MPGIYVDQHCDLSDLLNRANNDKGATLLIPDLQRPYVWAPRQVVLLVDSLIRGWPFGTLLTWKVGQDDPVRDLARPFWKVVNRTDDGDGEKLSSSNPPASFQMVLDGQQRVQSLLLAVGGDGWGFRLYDRDWSAALTDQKPRAKQSLRHWSQGCLCVDLQAFVAAYAEKKSIAALDYTQILKWVVTGGPQAQSAVEKPTTYQEALIKTDTPANRARYVRLSRLWDVAPSTSSIETELAEAHAAKLLATHGMSEEEIEPMRRAVGSLLMALARVKQTRVTYLELAEFDPQMFARETYNDAVVNIFTRLNTAGRTLTREDITFAWLKVGWKPAKTDGRNATQCFNDLGDALAEMKLKLDVEDRVAGLSFIWSTYHAEGRLLSNNDLLRGDAIRPMAEDLSNNWNALTAAIEKVSDVVAERGFVRYEHYESLSSLFVLWAWQYAADQWLASHPQKSLESDAYEKKIAAVLSGAADRWLMCSQWARRWTFASAETIAGYAKRLADCAGLIQLTSSADEAAEELKRYLEEEVDALVSDATAGIQGLSARSRDLVRIYYGPLWIWHRLEAKRWQMSRIPLRSGKRNKVNLEVDHAVAYSVWEPRCASEIQSGTAAHADAVGIINQIGNCSLLEKSFNISKSDRSLKSFLEAVHEVKSDKIQLDDWADAMKVGAAMMDPATATAEEVMIAIRERDALIRNELAEFIRGERTRVDLEMAGTAVVSTDTSSAVIEP